MKICIFLKLAITFGRVLGPSPLYKEALRFMDKMWDAIPIWSNGLILKVNTKSYFLTNNCYTRQEK